MKSHAILVILLSVPFLINAQKNTFVELSFGYMQNVNSIQLEDPSAKAYFDFRSLENGAVTPAVFLAISQEISSMISIKSGAELSYAKFKTEFISPIVEVRELKRNLISVPFLVKLRFLPTRSWHPYLETGIITSYMISEQIYSKDANRNYTENIYRSDQDVEYNSLLFSAAGNIGFSKQWTAKSLVYLEANSSYQLDKIEEFGISEKLFRIGLTLGLKVNI